MFISFVKFIHLPGISCIKKKTIVKTKYVNIGDSSSIIMALRIGVSNYCVEVKEYEICLCVHIAKCRNC